MLVYTIKRERAEATCISRLACGLWRTDYADRPAELTRQPPALARRPRAGRPFSPRASGAAALPVG